MPVAEALDRVLEILRTTELYSPQLGTKDEDPHTNDLVGGLMTVSCSNLLIMTERPESTSLGTFRGFGLIIWKERERSLSWNSCQVGSLGNDPRGSVRLSFVLL